MEIIIYQKVGDTVTRKEGFIELDQILKKIDVDTTNYDTVLDSDNIEYLDLGRVLNFTYNNQKYYFKAFMYDFDTPYSELIAGYLLKDFNLPYVEYDLAIVGGQKGVISKDFHKENATYINENDILKKYYLAINKNNPDIYDIDSLNSLEGIWNSLDYYFKDRIDKEKIVANLMDKIVDLFIFDIITDQNDRHSHNWQIIEENEKFDLGPVFDNEKIGFNISDKPFIQMTVDDKTDSLFSNYKTFIDISDSSYYNRILDKMWIISPNNLNKIFSKIEEKTNYPVPLEVKDRFLQIFQKHLIRLTRSDIRKK